MHPKSGSVAGGSFVVLLGSGFRYPAGPEPIGTSSAEIWKVVFLKFLALVTSSFLFLVERPGAPSSVLAPSSDARSP